MSSTDFSETDFLPSGKFLVLFDGYCNLCTGAVRFILRRDSNARFLFSSLSGETAQKVMAAFPDKAGKDSLLVYHRGRLYTQSDAVLKIAGSLSGLWPVFTVFWIVPRFLRNAAYRFISRYRYRWFGHRNTCMVPSEDVSNRFLP